MSENEILLAISDLMDKKLKHINERLIHMEGDMNNGFHRISLILENEIRPDIKLLAENYLPAATQYEKSVMELTSIQNDIELLKNVVIEHSEILQRIS